MCARSARRSPEPEHAMASDRTKRTVAVVGVDLFSKVPALPVAAARGLLIFAPYPEMHIVNVRSVPAGPSGPVAYGDSVEARTLVDIERELAALDELGSRYTVGTPVRVFSHVRVGDEARELVALARTLHADFIMIGHHEMDTAKLVLHGPENIEADVRGAAPCPVFVASAASAIRRRDGARPASSPDPESSPPVR